MPPDRAVAYFQKVRLGGVRLEPTSGRFWAASSESARSARPSTRAPACQSAPPTMGCWPQGDPPLLLRAFRGARAPPRKAPDLPLGGARGVSPAAFLGAGRNFDAMSLDHTKTALAVTAVVVGLAGMAALVYVEVRGL